MAARLALLLALLFIPIIVPVDRSPAGEPAQKAVLLNVSAGQVPSDTGQDDKTKPEIVDVKELGGKALRVAFAPGDSFGGRAGANKNWKRFAFFRFDAFNRSAAVIALELSVVHGRSSSYQTRVVVPIKLKPGRSEVKIGIDEMSNVNGSSPDLANVVRWHIIDQDNKAPTVYFSDIWLDGGDAPADPAVAARPQPLVGYRVKGKIGQMDVDLTVTPFRVSASPFGASAAVHGDPARVARIRATTMPKFDRPVSFDTPEADAVVSALEVFPSDNPWNLDVSAWPLHPNSKNIIASIGPNKPLRYNPDMGYVLVPPNQKNVDVKIVGYAGESDRGPFPVPDNVPIEGWPVNYLSGKRKVSLEDVQRDTLKEDGDRHALVVDPVAGMLYEFYQLKKTDAVWQAAQTSIFNLKSNKMRPEEWTSSDAAGLPVFPSVVRYDELKRGVVEHALRVSVVKTRRAYVYPARHYASRLTDPNLPRMGERIRLRKEFDVSGFSRDVQTVLKGLQKYGMFVADNGIDWALSVAPDPRIPVLHAELRKIQGKEFEVVQAPAGYRPPD
jgi:hypothetical protein